MISKSKKISPVRRNVQELIDFVSNPDCDTLSDRCKTWLEIATWSTARLSVALRERGMIICYYWQLARLQVVWGITGSVMAFRRWAFNNFVFSYNLSAYLAN